MVSPHQSLLAKSVSKFQCILKCLNHEYCITPAFIPSSNDGMVGNCIIADYIDSTVGNIIVFEEIFTSAYPTDLPTTDQTTYDPNTDLSTFNPSVSPSTDAVTDPNIFPDTDFSTFEPNSDLPPVTEHITGNNNDVK